MLAVSISRFQDNQISTRRGIWRNGIAQDWDPSGPNVSREHQDPAAAAVFDRQFHTGRAKNVPGVKKTKTHSWCDLARLGVRQLEEERLHSRHFFGAIERLDKPLALAPQLPVSSFYVRSLEMSRVFEDELREVRRGSRGVYSAPETSLHEQWQPAAVVEMSVSENNSVKPAGSQPAHIAILTVRRITSLVQTEIDKDPSGSGFDEAARPGDLSARRTAELDLHAKLRPQRAAPFMANRQDLPS
jgi:hypothetical protein